MRRDRFSANISARDMLGKCRDFMTNLEERARQAISITNERTQIHASPADKIYIPSATGKLFHDDTSFVKLVMGPYGSGKSTMCVQEIVRRAATMPYWHSGRRRARWAVVRNTSGELYSTTLQTWLTWFDELGDIRKRQKPILTYEHSFNDGQGVIELELIYIALDRPEDVRKIKSLELTGVYLNELSELPQNVLSHFKGRVNGRYPSRSFCPEPYWSGIIADTNPPDEDHWIYKDFEENITPSYKIFKQPSGLLIDERGDFIKAKDGNYIQNTECDNAQHLSRDYYVKLAEKQKEGFVKVYCGGKYGLVESGKRCYPEYNDDIHSVASIPALQGLPIHLGWDFGFTPACIVFQISPRGQFRALKEYVAEEMGIKTFARNIVLPSLAVDFPYNKIGESEADPAGNIGEGIMEELSEIGELINLGIRTNAASSNDIDVRHSAVRFFLNCMIDGHPGFILSREGCPVLRKGFVNGYHFRRLSVGGEERYHEKPNKNKFSHPHDALQYGAMKFASDRVIADKGQPKCEDISNPVMRWN